MTPTDGRCPDSDGPTMERGQRRGSYLLGRTVDDRTVDDRTMSDRTMYDMARPTGPETGPDSWKGPGGE